MQVAVKLVIIDDAFLDIGNFNEFQISQIRHHCDLRQKQTVENCIKDCVSQYGEAVEKYCAICEKHYDKVATMAEWVKLYASQTREFWTELYRCAVFADFSGHIPRIVHIVRTVSFELLADYFELISNDHY